MVEKRGSIFDDPGVKDFLVHVVLRFLGILGKWIRDRYGIGEK